MATNAYSVIEALADPTRRAIFEQVASAESSVGALAGRLPVSRPAVSQHLRVLKNAHLVQVRAQGTRRLYSVDAAGLTAAKQYFEQFWADALHSFVTHADRIAEQESIA